MKLFNKIWNTFDQPGYIYNGNNFKSFKPWTFMDAGIAMVVNNTTDLWHLFNSSPGLYGSNPRDRSKGFALKHLLLKKEKIPWILLKTIDNVKYRFY
ncbi:MAG: hypothetical protein IPJ39_00185 [Saprospiraceae bacterium]|nr:hypothetical protein [Saprospiraceae bacterium]